jgi:hypothetical protein
MDMNYIINHIATTKNRPEYMGYVTNTNNIDNNHIIYTDFNASYRHEVRYDITTAAKSHNGVGISSIYAA